MDLMSTAQLLGNFGEFFGSIAVVVTLVYLAGQLRQNTKALRSSANESFATLGIGINDFVARHSEDMIKVTHGVGEFGERVGTDAMKSEDLVFISYAHRNFRIMEATYLHHREGTLPYGVFEARTQGFAKVFEDQPGLSIVWSYGQDLGYPDDFRQYMSTRVVGKSES